MPFLEFVFQRSWLEAVLIFFVAGCLYVSCVILYRLTLHPLARYPGPFLARITDWYSVYHAWKGDRHLDFYRIHEKYGKFVRFGPNSLSVDSNTALKDIYGHTGNVRKSQFYGVFPTQPNMFNTHSSIDKVLHARKRRVLSQAFSDGAIRAMEKYLLDNIRTFCQGLHQTGRTASEDYNVWSLPRNMADWCNYLAFDIMGDLCFGKAFGMLEKADNRFAIELISNAAHRHLICGTLPVLHRYHLDKVLFNKISTGRERYMAYSRSQALERTQKGSDSDRKDFFHYLLSAKDPETGTGFTTSELWAESNLLIIAGSDTTSTALSATFFYLNHNRPSLSRALDEIRTMFSDVEDIVNGSKLSQCIFLRACIDEAMRLSPPVGGLLPREIQSGGATIDGADLPAGVIVGTPHYAIHHNTDYFPEPFSYLPERWIVGSSPAVTIDTVNLARSAFCPFSVGPRGCIGKGMAYTELMVSLARVLFLYDMRLSPGTHNGEGHSDLEYGRRRTTEYQLQDCFTSKKDGPMIEFKSRN